MKNYCIKNEMDKSYEAELEMTNYQNNKLTQRDIEYTDFLCWILEQKNEGYDVCIIKGEDYDSFMNSEEEIDMKMIIVEAKDFYKEFRKVSNVDLFDEKCFISMTYIYENQNDVNLIVKDGNGINKRFVIGIVG